VTFTGRGLPQVRISAADWVQILGCSIRHFWSLLSFFESKRILRRFRDGRSVVVEMAPLEEILSRAQTDLADDLEASAAAFRRIYKQNPLATSNASSCFPPPIAVENSASDESRDLVRRALHGFVLTDSNGFHLQNPPAWARTPPDDQIVDEVIKIMGDNLQYLYQVLKSIKYAGQKPDRSYAWFVSVLRKSLAISGGE
jgi:hypothetical protein